MLSLPLAEKNRVVIACAGAGKTTKIVKESIELNKKILIITYTNEGEEEIKQGFYKENGFIPQNIKIKTWYSFLLEHCVRPYQNLIYPEEILIKFDPDIIRNKKSKYKKTDYQYFVNKKGYVYKDYVSNFAFELNKKSNNLVVKRLEKIFEVIMIDEVQDTKGWDYDFIAELFKTKIRVFVVGDPRQDILRTNYAGNKNNSKDIFTYLQEKKDKNQLDFCTVEMAETFRCCKELCDFINNLGLFPSYPNMISSTQYSAEIDLLGVGKINENDLYDFIKKYHPVILRYNKGIDTKNLPAINIGYSKGRTYDRVLLFGSKTMVNFLNNSISSFEDKQRLYVALTRARFSFHYFDDSVENSQDTLF